MAMVVISAITLQTIAFAQLRFFVSVLMSGSGKLSGSGKSICTASVCMFSIIMFIKYSSVQFEPNLKTIEHA